jgi:glycosyltransferase involved in cell wall biosynthesis
VEERLSVGQQETVDGVRFVGLGPTSAAGKYLSRWWSFLASERPNWWYFQGADPLWGALLLVARTHGVRAIFSAAFDSDVQPRIALTRREGWWPLYAWGLNRAERIFVQHGRQLADLSRKLQPKAEVLPGVVGLPERIKPPRERGRYVAWVALLRQPKRPDVLIDMARKHPDLQFVVCGGTTNHRTPEGYGERMADDLRSLPNVTYRGHVAPDQTLEVISRAHALLSTSDQEGFPSTFLEAWSAGTPVVSLKIDPDSLIRTRGLGFVSGTIDRAASDIRGLLDSAELFESVSRNALNYVREVHSEASVARCFDHAIRRNDDA